MIIPGQHLDPQRLKTIFQPLTEAQTKDLVKHLEQMAREHPQRYRLRVGGLAILGYLYILMIFAGLAGGLWILRQLCIAFNQTELLPTLYLVALIVALVVIRMFWLTIPSPKGVEISAESFPQLFALTQTLTRSLQTPAIHHILLTGEVNAGILQRPRLGILGWFENYLVLGLPLMQALSPDQIKAVIAHELGHLSGNHSRFRNWIYRIRRTWLELAGRLDQQDATGWFFKRFFQWYGPFFNAYSFVLARANEYEADRIAAEQADAQAAAEALIRTNLFGYLWAYREQIWETQQAATSPTPPAHKISDLLESTQALIPPQSQRWLRQILADQTDTDDTHPCLTDRLKALDYAIDPDHLPRPLERSAAQVYLGDRIPDLAQHLDQLWQKENDRIWKRYHEQVQVQQQTLHDLEILASSGTLTSDLGWKRARLIQTLQGSQAARPILETLVHQDPHHGLSHYQLGIIQLKQNDHRGLEHLKQAMDLDPALVIPAGEQLAQHYRAQGEISTAEQLEHRIQASRQIWESAMRERLQIGPKDPFLAPQLSKLQIDQIRQALSYYPDIHEALLAQKQVQQFPNRPLFVLAIARQFLPGQGPDRQSDPEVIQELEIRISLPGDLIIKSLYPGTLNLFAALRRVQGTRILPKDLSPDHPST